MRKVKKKHIPCKFNSNILYSLDNSGKFELYYTCAEKSQWFTICVKVKKYSVSSFRLKFYVIEQISIYIVEVALSVVLAQLVQKVCRSKSHLMSARSLMAPPRKEKCAPSSDKSVQESTKYLQSVIQSSVTGLDVEACIYFVLC